MSDSSWHIRKRFSASASMAVARRSAIFGGERFLAEWDALLAEAVGGAKLSAIAGGAGE